MKRLLIIRHAKSSWEYEQLHDLERPLTDRGKKDAVLMGGLLRKKNIYPDCMISSPAIRAVSTARIFCDEVGFDKNKLEIDADLYFKELEQMMQVIQQKGSRIATIALFGHNPAFTNLSNRFAPNFTDMLPTCGIVSVQFAVESWRLTEAGNGKLEFFEYPKKYR